MPRKMSERGPKRVWAGILIIVAAIVGGLGGYAYVRQSRKSPTAIVIGGTSIANLGSRAAAEEALSQAKRSKADGIATGRLRFTEPVTLRRADTGSAISGFQQAVEAVQQAAGVEAEVYAIAVDGVPVVGLRSEKDAQKALDLVKAYYERGRTLVGASSFKGKVFISKQFINTEGFCESPESARDALTTASEPAVTHTVAIGDRGEGIAERYDLTLDQLEEMNPGKDIDRLELGDVLVIERAEYPITVVNKAMVNTTVQITPPREAAARIGRRVVKMMVTYENGEPVAQDVISQLTTWERSHVRRSRRSRKSHTEQPTTAKTAPASDMLTPSPTPAPEAQ